MHTDSKTYPPHPLDMWELMVEALRPLAMGLTAMSPADPTELTDCFLDMDSMMTYEGVGLAEDLFAHCCKFAPRLAEVCDEGDRRYLPKWVSNELRQVRHDVELLGWLMWGLGPAMVETLSLGGTCKDFPDTPGGALIKAARIAEASYARVGTKRDDYIAAQHISVDQEWIDHVEAEAAESGLTIEQLAKGRGCTHLLGRLGDKGKVPRWEEVAQ